MLNCYYIYLNYYKQYKRWHRSHMLLYSIQPQSCERKLRRKHLLSSKKKMLVGVNTKTLTQIHCRTNSKSCGIISSFQMLSAKSIQAICKSTMRTHKYGSVLHTLTAQPPTASELLDPPDVCHTALQLPNRAMAERQSCLLRSWFHNLELGRNFWLQSG